MDRKIAIGIALGVAGVAAGAALTAAAIAVTKKITTIAQEMEADGGECTFISPGGNNSVTLAYGSSATANGLTHIELTASAEGKKDCSLSAYARKSSELFESEWIDNNHFKLLIGSTNRKQCYEVTFGEKKIRADYSLCKVEKGN